MSLNMLTNLSIIGLEYPLSPDFTTAPLLSGYKEYFDVLIDPNPRPLWDNLINDSNFIDPYLNSHEKIVNNMTNLVDQIEQWFDFIEPTVFLPFQYTDPFPNPIFDWILNFEPGWFYYDKSRILTFLEGRTQFVISQLP